MERGKEDGLRSGRPQSIRGREYSRQEGGVEVVEVVVVVEVEGGDGGRLKERRSRGRGNSGGSEWLRCYGVTVLRGDG